MRGGWVGFRWGTEIWGARIGMVGGEEADGWTAAGYGTACNVPVFHAPRSTTLPTSYLHTYMNGYC